MATLNGGVSQEGMTCLAGAKVACLLSKRHRLIDGHRKTLESLSACLSGQGQQV